MTMFNEPILKQRLNVHRLKHIVLYNKYLCSDSSGLIFYTINNSVE